MISLRLYGPMGIATRDGPIAMRLGTKARALVALLATAPDMTRSRIWLQDKLWSVQSPKNASASLRQMLYQLRQALGRDAGALRSDRRDVSFDPAQVVVAAPDDMGEFLEGLDVRDPEFESWLAVRRSAARAGSDVTAPAVRLAEAACPASVGIRVTADRVPDQGLTAQRVADMFAEALRERAMTEIHLADDDRAADLTLKLEVFPGEGGLLRGELCETAGRRHFWAQTVPMPGGPSAPFDPADFAPMINSGVEAVIMARTRRRDRGGDPASAVHLAVRHIFGYSVADLQKAEDLLRELPVPGATPLAWRIFLRMVQCVERTRVADAAFVDEVELLVQTALSMDNRNSLVLAVSAHACLNVLDRPEEALILARDAAAICPSNPFAFDAMAGSLIRCGDFEAGYRMAVQARRLGRSSPAQHFFEMGECLAGVATERFDEARLLARRVAAVAPSSRPALRYVAILEAHSGALDAADAALGRLRMVEQGFDIRQVAEDEAYPVASFRKSRVPQDILRPFY